MGRRRDVGRAVRRMAAPDAPAQAPVVEEAAGKDDRLVVVDANVIISGIRLE